VTVFFLCGLWHGASWNFVVWGLWHGLFLVVERRFGNSPARRFTTSPILEWPIWPHAYAMLVVIVGWVFFRAPTLSAAIGFLDAMAGFGVAAPTAYAPGWYFTPELCLALAAGAIGSTPWVPALADALARRRRSDAAIAASALSVVTLIVLFGASIMEVAAGTYNPFIYFKF
jgi:alginate O-acetyltransferase complex protein AlgI